ncbi:MAG: UDP-4-keto-6-deoxy-N-acetylglucosamine 4-aminotransferase [bacterium]|nr:UDP-4-keto-6-deoxy-N-acetylglucosamine 4-aminotransferase [bacterium]
MSRIPYGRQLIDDDDIAAVVRVLKSDYLTTGPEVEAFESELAAACGARHAVVVANGTAALHCAYAAAGLTRGDEVVTTPLTFSATSNMLLALGARPVFADVAAGTLCLDPSQTAAAITERTRALAPVDFAGQPADLEAFMALAKKHDLVVVEDASHSIGGTRRGRPVGSLAHLTTFSFHPVKTITAAEGGAVLTDDDRLAQRARDFRNHGLVRDAARLQRHDGPWHYEIQTLGFNYRLTDVQCALGRSQLAKLGRFAQRRRDIVATYRRAFAGEPRLRMQQLDDAAEPTWHLFVVQVANRAAFFQALTRRDILPQVHYGAVNDMPLYRELGYDPQATPVALAASHKLVSLPLYPAMSDDDVARVVTAVRQALDESEAP